MVLLLIIPLLSSVVALMSSVHLSRKISIVAALINLGLTCYLLLAGTNETLSIDLAWIPSLGIRFALSVDGLSMVLMLLTNLIVPLVIATIPDTPERPSVFYSLLLFMQMALSGVFMAQDGFLFYVFWELALIPIWFICLVWGGENKSKITLKFFLYTLTGSLLMLIALIDVYLHTPGDHSFRLSDLVTAGASMGDTEQGLVFWGLFMAFAIKIPIFPFHSWQPDTYSNAPTAGTMMLSALMLKMGTYGLIRWLIPMVPSAVKMWSDVAMLLAVIGVVYAAVLALTQKEFKRLLAYSSMSHVGLIAAGTLTISVSGIQGAVFQMFSHGLLVFGLFYIVDIIERRTTFKNLQDLGGLRHTAPRLATAFLILLLGSIALPLTSGFVGEFLLISSLVRANFWMGAVAGLSIILGAIYMLRAFQMSMSGEVSKAAQQTTDLTIQEQVILYTVIALVILLGIYPAPLLNLSEIVANQIVALAGNLNSVTH